MRAAILLGLAILAVAASTLLVDPTFVEQGVHAGARHAAEWYAAFGKVLRLLARVAASRNN